MTNALAEGLTQNKEVLDRLNLIETYDRFQWDPFMEMWVKGTRLEGVYETGDLFLDQYIKQISDHSHLVNVHVSNLETETWDGRPIELIVNDAWKSLSIVQNTVSQFFPSLMSDN